MSRNKRVEQGTERGIQDREGAGAGLLRERAASLGNLQVRKMVSKERRVCSEAHHGDVDTGKKLFSSF